MMQWSTWRGYFTGEYVDVVLVLGDCEVGGEKEEDFLVSEEWEVSTGVHYSVDWFMIISGNIVVVA